MTSTRDSQRTDRDNLVGLVNHSTAKHTLFNNSARQRLSGPVGLLGMVIGIAMVIAGPILAALFVTAWDLFATAFIPPNTNAAGIEIPGGVRPS